MAGKYYSLTDNTQHSTCVETAKEIYWWTDVWDIILTCVVSISMQNFILAEALNILQSILNIMKKMRLLLIYSDSKN